MENVDISTVLSDQQIRVFDKNACHEKCARRFQAGLWHSFNGFDTVSFITRNLETRQPKQWEMSKLTKPKSVKMAENTENQENTEK